ncbi:histidine kinase-like ATPase [Ochromonadaceae sp. CCMP2298]|nr:histidine kinase-like ATPase [Ochromonadaceae sp. CCMP2298]
MYHYLLSHTHTHSLTHAHTHTLTHTHTYIHTHTHTLTHTHTHTHTHIYTNTHTRTHTLSRYTSKKKTGLLYEPSLITSSKYTIHFYPRKAFYDEYTSHNPIYFSIGGVSLIALVSLIFLLYDFAVSRRSERQQVVLDTKRRYVRFISHEIRTPLNTVRLGLKLFDLELIASLKMLSEKPPAEAVQIMRRTIEGWVQVTDDALSSTEAAVDVLNDLLNYDKIESGTLRLEFSSVPIWQVVKKTTACFAMQAREKNVSLSLTGALWDELSPRDLTQYQALQVVGDSMRISQVLRNLMSNALKFTPTSGTVSVHAEWLPEALADAEIDMTQQESQQWLTYARAGAVRVSVTDTGAGLSPAQLLEIGAEGVQFNANQLQAGQGAGLGLFISKGICIQHGGTFEVTSRGLDCGATFSILLPLFEIRNASDSSLAVKMQGGSAPIHDSDADTVVTFHSLHRPQRVLVVDDATSNRRMLMRILRTKQYVCEEAEDGREALERYAAAVERGEPFDAILSDYEMPVMNGPDSVWEMRRLGCKCFIAGITGNVMQDDIDHFKMRGADSVLAKVRSCIECRV